MVQQLEHISCGIKECFNHVLGKDLGFPSLCAIGCLIPQREVPVVPVAAGTPLPLQGLGTAGTFREQFW